MSKKKRVLVITLIVVPLILSLLVIFYLKSSWQIVLPSGEKLSPIENKPLFVGLVLFTIGYLFFLGMIFSDNLLELVNRRINIHKR